MGEVASLSPDETLQRLSSTAGGLTPDQVEEQLRSVGRNQVAHQARHTILGELVGRSINPLNLLLLTLATASYFLGDQRAAIVIAVMVILSISLSFIQEHRSNNAADKLQRMVSITATVRRQVGAEAHDHVDVPIEQLVPGDIVLLSAGDMIPADLRLISAKDLFINQSTLTGEAMPLEKFAAGHVGTAETPFDLPNICFMGSAVVSGIGCGVVVLTGPRTAFGLVASAIAKQRVLTSFDKGITRFTWVMLGFILVMAPLVFVINGLTKGNWLEAFAAIATLKASGVQVKILTGDNDIVTRKICHEVGLPVDRIVLGSEMATLSPDELASLAETAAVFAKVSPSQKAAIIDALHRKGHVVGFLGDGINDGPALKAADVGISVDSAVDIAKDSADIILLEKSLAVLGEGVIEGRKVFGNITKYIKMGASSNFGNMFSVLGASVILPFLPMTAIQVLTNNLLYDFSQTTIPTDNVDAEYLAVPRRWDIGNITKFVLFIGPISSIFDYVTYFTMLYIFNAWSNPALFQTGWFVESLLTQTLIIHIIRTAKIPFLESRASTALITTTIIIAAIGITLPFTWLGGFLGFVPLPPAYWFCLCLILLSYVVLTHFMKTWFIRRFGLS